MKRNWKKILAAVLAVSIILGNFSPAYATEMQTVVETVQEEEKLDADEAAEEIVEIPVEEAKTLSVDSEIESEDVTTNSEVEEEGTAEVQNVVTMSNEDNSWIYEENESWDGEKDGTISITGYTKELSGEIILPSELDGKKVTGIGNSAFYECTDIKKVIIPEGVTEIYSEAFYGCTSLESVILPESLTLVGESVFEDCTSLKEITLPSSLDTIGQWMFRYCENLETVNLPETITWIQVGAFAECRNLKNIDVKSVTTFGRNAFEDCSSLEKVEFHDDATIGESAFYFCTSLEEITLPENLTELKYATFGYCYGLQKVEFPENLEIIGSSAFSCCALQGELVIPKTVTMIGSSAFYSNNITKVIIPNSIEKIENDTFGNCQQLAEIIIPETVMSIGEGAFRDCYALEEIEIPNGVTEIGTGAFESCRNLKKVIIPDTVELIGEDAFLYSGIYSDGLVIYCYQDSCAYNYAKENDIDIYVMEKKPDYQLKYNVDSDMGTVEITGYTGICAGKITIPEIIDGYLVTKIGDNAFFNCSGLTGNLKIPEGVTQIGNNAFKGCSGLDGDLTLPKNILKISENAFSGCNNISEIYYTGTESQWNEVTIEEPNDIFTSKEINFNVAKTYELTYDVDIFTDKASITGYTGIASGDLIIPGEIDGYDVIGIGMYAFQNETGFDGRLILDENLENIASYAFDGCSNLKGELCLPENLYSIGSDAFRGCKGFYGDLILPDSVKYVSSGAFEDCTGFNGKLVISSSIQDISENVFSGCSGLCGELIIPSNVTRIFTWAFKGCSGFSGTLEIPESVTFIKGYAFDGCTSLTKVVLPETIAMNGYCFANCTSLENVELYGGLECIPNGMFANCTNMDYFKIPSGILEIKKDAFNGCINLKEILIPNTVTKIAENSFAGCETLTIVGADGSYAQTYADEHDILFKVYTSDATELYITSELSLNVGEAYYFDVETDSYEVLDYIIWKSSNEKVAKVDDGRIIALEPGNAVITAKVGDLIAECYVEVLEGNNFNYVTSIEGFESEHNYKSECNAFWVYENSDAISISVTFNEDTEVEEDYDYLYIYDENADIIGEYTGNSLAGETIEVPGTKIMIQLVSDYSTECYGFKVIKINEKITEDTYTITFESQGGIPVSQFSDIVRGSQVILPVSEKNGYTFAGWYTEPNGKGERFLNEITVNDDMTLYAFWVVSKEDCGFVVAELEAQEYNGAKVTPSPQVFVGETQLIEGTDYTVSYKNNTKVGDAKVIVKGKGNYSSTITIDFEIIPKELNLSDFTAVSKDMIFNGKKCVSAPTVKYGTKVLKAGTDYTVSYSKNVVSIGKVTVTITGKGNYAGKIETEYRITAADISKVIADVIPVQSFNGEPIKPQIKLYASKENQKHDISLSMDNYSLTYENNVKVGKGKVIVSGIGSYGGSKTLNFTIDKKNLSAADIDVCIAENSSDMIYTGTALKPKVIVTYHDKILEEGIDYTVSYINNTNASANTKKMPTVIIKGKGNYKGQVNKTFEILPLEIDLLDISVADVKYNKGKALKPTVTVMVGKKKLSVGKDYTVSYLNNTEVAEKEALNAPTAIISGKGNYSGTIEKKFRIYRDVVSGFVVEKIPTQIYDGEPLRPDFKVYINKSEQKNGNALKTDAYCVSYENNVNAGTAKAIITGLGTYGGSKSVTFKIDKKSLAAEDINAILLDEFITYSGKKLTPEICVKDGEKNLVEGTDYTISYANNVNVPANSKKLPTITVKGKGNYSGNKMLTFEILPKSFSVDTSVVVKDVCYNAKKAVSTQGITTTVTVSDSDITLKAANYTVTYRNNRAIGDDSLENPPTLIIQGKGNYTGNIEKTFRIFGEDISKATISKVSAETYTGKEIEPHPTIILKGNKKEVKTLVEGTDYIISWENNVSVGKGTITINGIGEYGGTKKATFIISPMKMNNWNYNSISSGRVKCREIYNAEDGKLMWRDEYFYDEAGRVSRINQVYESGYMDGYALFYYDDNGKHVKTEWYGSWDGENFTLDSYYEKKYDAHGKFVHENGYYSNGKLKYYVDYFYDSEGKYTGFDLYNYDMSYYYDVTIPRNQERVFYNSDGTISYVQNYLLEEYYDTDYYSYDNVGYCKRITDGEDGYSECILDKKGRVETEYYYYNEKLSSYTRYFYEEGKEYVPIGLEIQYEDELFCDFYLWENKKAMW